MVFKVLGIFGLIMLVPIYAMMKIASDADDREEEYMRRALKDKQEKEE